MMSLTLRRHICHFGRSEKSNKQIFNQPIPKVVRFVIATHVDRRTRKSIGGFVAPPSGKSFHGSLPEGQGFDVGCSGAGLTNT
jgi:hypothetical protein